MSEYSEQSYWDGRYQLDTEPFEWYQPFSTLRPYIAPLLNPIHRHNISPSPRTNSNTPATPLRTLQPRRRASVADEQPPPPALDRPPSAVDPPAPSMRVLVLGCGCSEVSVEVWRMGEGRAEVHSVDFSVQCVEEMRRRYVLPGLHFHVQDVRGLTFPSDYFDLVIDKAALDCLHCLDTPDTATQVKLAVQCVHRVMRLGGTLLSVSSAPPEQRSSHFMLDRLEMMKGQLELEKKEKASRRVVGGGGAVDHSAAALQSPAGSKFATPTLLNRRVSVNGGARGSRRGSTVTSIDAMPVALLTKPVVHRLPKPASADSWEDSQSRALTRTSSIASTSAATLSTDGSPLLPVRRTSLLVDSMQLTANSAAEAETAAVVDDELSAVYDSSEHYLYLVHKELVAPTPQVQGLHSVGDTPMAGVRRSSLIGLPAHGRRMSAMGFAAA